ncbi:MAG: hypothetical protein KAK00_01350 [Nanoarchaeota archaeon]|nr:hypothetical protein [Nanoarchaeota archaeon]
MKSIKVKDYIIWGTIAALVILVILVLIIPGKEKSFEIKDRCGPIMNLISHTIADEPRCQTQCKAKCKTLDLEFSRIEFEKKEAGCHTCICFCKEDLFG